MDIIFDGIFVVSLARALDRRANVAQQFARLENPTSYEIIDAVDGYALDLASLPSVLDRNSKVFAKHPKRAGIAGFCLSYLSIFERAGRERLSWILILEDDFEFCRPAMPINTLSVADGAEVVALDTRMNRRGVGTIGTGFRLSAVEKILAALPLSESFDVWLSRHSYGTIGGGVHVPSETRYIHMDTTSYDDRNRLLRANEVGRKSYLGGAS